jgi:glycosyltransferase involved in cell wall biosynthesis
VCDEIALPTMPLGVSQPVVRVVIRAKNEAAKIGTTLDRLARQTIADQAEIVVVDSGSRDRTVEIARRAGARLIEIPSESFTYGGSLNTGCRDAETPFLVALSAHAPPVGPTWLERLLAPFGDERVCAVCGYEKSPDGGTLAAPLTQDESLAEAHPFWGYSNSAGAFRTELWRRRPFREDMPGTEDKEWALHWLREGYVVVVDPALVTEHSHADEGPIKTFRRARDEWLGFGSYLGLEPYGARELVRDWWHRLDGYPSHLRARTGPRRLVRLAGKWRGCAAAPTRGDGSGAPRGAPTNPESTGS